MPRVRSFLVALLAGAAILTAGACSELPTAPMPENVAPSHGLLGNLLGGSDAPRGEVAVLTRTVPLTENEVVTQWVGRLGGVIRLPRAGLTVVVPFGALQGSTRITVTAPAGNLVGYDFQPHGLRFERPLTLTQDLLSTDGLGALDLQAVYFDGELGATVAPLENLPVWLLSTLGIYRVEHFSGYAMARRGYVVATN